ncbi:hypothetical protein GNI_037520 [Gregarina niphandrodes]|uniref:Uncharacterized protein n=1 Tax=Gregarina niphandrodes TaxID=110365 RepID=A0A023BAL7_GRENI|nr:hypothetical protein GNI_037520 [Gregarina niphandrodes]EZG78354.1 hypothetical protein GNI_037520 [Gregarina niphandrodes]|eukprot:XP_011129334.1 hypothetical protein GNI_037520 [Gregarina niphandrodes]
MCFHDREFGDYSDQIGIPKIVKRIVGETDSFASRDALDLNPTSGTVSSPGVEPGSWEYLRSLCDALKDPLLLAYHCGYLTLLSYNKPFDVYEVAFPNDEVKFGVLKLAAPLCMSKKMSRSFIRDLCRQLQFGKIEPFFKTLGKYFKHVPSPGVRMMAVAVVYS